MRPLLAARPPFHPGAPMTSSASTHMTRTLFVCFALVYVVLYDRALSDAEALALD